MWDQLFIFFRSHPLICKIVRIMNIILTSRIVLRLKRVHVHSGWSACRIPSPSSVNDWRRYDLRKVLEYTRYTSAPGPLHLLVLGPGTLYPQVLSWLFSHLLNFLVYIVFSVRPFLTILFNIVTHFPASTPTFPILPPSLFFSIALITLWHTIFYWIFIYCLSPPTGI